MLALAWRYRAGLHSRRGPADLAGFDGSCRAGAGRTGHRRDSPCRRSGRGRRRAGPGVADVPADWPPLAVVAGIALAIVLMALVQSTLRYRTAIVTARLSQRIVVELRCDVYDKLQRLSFRFFDANASRLDHQSRGRRRAGHADVRRRRDHRSADRRAVAGGLSGLHASASTPGLTLASLATTPLLWLGRSDLFASRQAGLSAQPAC